MLSKDTLDKAFAGFEALDSRISQQFMQDMRAISRNPFGFSEEELKALAAKVIAEGDFKPNNTNT